MGKLAKLSNFLSKDTKEVSKSTLTLLFLSLLVLSLCTFTIGLVVGIHIGGNIDETATSAEGITETKKIAPRMTYFGEANDNWHYYVDEETDVIYITMSPVGSAMDTRFGITPALNADGTPVTRTQMLND